MSDQLVHHPADITRESPVGRTKRERHNLAAIERRIAWLDHRLAETRAAGIAHDWDAQELRALRWALSRIAELERIEP